MFHAPIFFSLKNRVPSCNHKLHMHSILPESIDLLFFDSCNKPYIKLFIRLWQLQIGDNFFGYDLTYDSENTGTSVAGRNQRGHSLVAGSSSSKSVARVHSLDNLISIIQLREVISLSQVSFQRWNSKYFNIPFLIILYISYQPPITLKPSENQPAQDATEVAIVKLLIKSYYDIVRKSIEDAVPKAIMHFLVSLAFYILLLVNESFDGD